ncbi:hypothetical protein OG241_18520 [Streptomyces sp. NBC_01390]|uniref:hypothetical protein n=1 Tax=Streptomyces sp. NBC_01390 TaxID=2903850 RepID=UPI003243E1B0
MTRLRRLVATAAVVAVPLISGCQGSGDVAASASPEAAVSARPAASSAAVGKTQADVVSDARFATTGFDGGLRLAKDPYKRDCVVYATALSTGIPGKGELVATVSKLEKRGWRLDGPISMAEGTYLESGEWSVILGVGAVPDQAKEQSAPYTGALAFGASGKCKRSADPATAPPLPPTLPSTS